MTQIPEAVLFLQGSASGSFVCCILAFIVHWAGRGNVSGMIKSGELDVRTVIPVTDKQRRFADEYLVDCNISRAYMAAYPRVKSVFVASTNGGRLLKNAEIKSYIDEQLEKLSSERVATAQEVLEYLSSVMRGETLEDVVVVVGCGEGKSAARTIQKRPSERDRLKAAELLAKHFQLFIPKIQVEADQGGGVIILAEAIEGEP